MMLRRFQQTAMIFAFTVVLLIVPQAAFAQSQPEILPTGMSITPLAEPGTTFQFLNPGLPLFRTSVWIWRSPQRSARMEARS
jgi:hypothetical protein